MPAASKNKKFYVILGIGLTLLALFSFYGPSKNESIQANFGSSSVKPVKLNDWIGASLSKNAYSDIETKPASPPAVENTNLKAQALKEIFDKEDLCQLVKLDAYYGADIANYFATKDTSILMDLVKKGESLDARSFTGNPLVETFLRALYFSGLVTSGEGNSPVDKAIADPLWEELYTKDAGNGAIDFFYMSYLSKLGTKPEELIRYAEAVVKKPKFENYYFHVTRNIYEDTLRGPAHWAVGNGIIASMPIPDFVTGFKVLRKILEVTTDAAFKNRLSEWAQEQTYRPQKLNGDLEMVEWSIVHYYTSELLLKKLGVRVPHYKDLVLTEADKNWIQFQIDAMAEVFDYDKKGCSTAQVEEVIRRQKELYEKAQRLSQ